MTAWTDTVSKVYKENKAKNPNYKLKDAMKDAKKVYKSGSSTASVSSVSKSRKSRKSKKSRKSRKSRKH